jgi:Zn-dependent protease with chaperone function
MLKRFLKWQLNAIEIAPGVLCSKNFNSIAMCVGPVIIISSFSLYLPPEEILAVILHEKAHWYFKHIFKQLLGFFFYSNSSFIELMWNQELEADLWVASAGMKLPMLNFLNRCSYSDCDSHPPIKLRIENLVKNG